MKTWQTGVMVAKKDFCQAGENLETGASCTSCFILQRTSWLFMHLLLLSLSCFSFSSLMYPWITS